MAETETTRQDLERLIRRVEAMDASQPANAQVREQLLLKLRAQLVEVNGDLDRQRAGGAARFLAMARAVAARAQSAFGQ